ncbi:MAG TPA: transcription antitermination factor NusB [Dehalococcoidia bacterium]|nr:transcription antitermination factor NusB [Dehalococcoidia bacterium]
MAGLRHKARVVALQALYESDSSKHDTRTCLTRLAEEQSLPESALSFAMELVDGVLKHKTRIDAMIQTHAPIWPVEQLSVIDRNILRLAIFEISINNKVPLKAAINEAVELAKAFGSDSSPKFVNGVLGAVSQAQVNSS